LAVCPPASALAGAAGSSRTSAALRSCRLCQLGRQLTFCNGAIGTGCIAVQPVHLQQVGRCFLISACHQRSRGAQNAGLIVPGHRCAVVAGKSVCVQAVPVQHVAGRIPGSLGVQVERLLVSTQGIALVGAFLVVLPLFPGKVIFPLLLGVPLVPIVGRQGRRADVLYRVPEVVPVIVVFVPSLFALVGKEILPRRVVGKVAAVCTAVQRLGVGHAGKGTQQVVLLVLVFAQCLASQAGYRIVNAAQRLLLALLCHAVGVAAAIPARQHRRVGLGVLRAGGSIGLGLGAVLLVGFAAGIPVEPAADLPGQAVHCVLVPAHIVRRAVGVPFPLFLFRLVLSP